MSYRFQEFYIRDQMMPGILNYIDRGILPGSFLQAIICNDLKEAVGRADYENMRNIPAFVNYFHNHAPWPCWGSEEKMNAWMLMHERTRIKASYEKGECPRCDTPIPESAADGDECESKGCGWIFDRGLYIDEHEDQTDQQGAD